MIEISSNLTELIMAYEKFWSENTFSQIINNNISNKYGFKGNEIADIPYNIDPNISPNINPDFKPNINLKISYIDKLKDLLTKINTETYYQYLLKLMNEKNLTSVEIYTKAMISKEQFSKIISGKNNRKAYIPKKQWLLKIAFAMELSFDETTNLLNKAGHSFIESDKSDFVFIFFLENKIYDSCDIEDLLKYNDLPSLFESA